MEGCLVLRQLNEVILKIQFSEQGLCWLDVELKEKNSILERDLYPGL